MTSILKRYKNTKPAPKKTMSDHAEDALYREVWEEVNAQKTYTFVKKHAKWLVALALVILIAVVGIHIYRNHQQNNLVESTRKYETAVAIMSGGQSDLASAAFMKAAEESSKGMEDIAILQSARMDISNNDKASAIEKLTILSKKGNMRDFRDLATINLAILQGDSMSAKDMERMLAPVQTKRSPFYFTGMLLVGQKYLSEGNHESANKWLDKIINDKDAPASIVGMATSIR